MRSRQPRETVAAHRASVSCQAPLTTLAETDNGGVSCSRTMVRAKSPVAS